MSRKTYLQLQMSPRTTVKVAAASLGALILLAIGNIFRTPIQHAYSLATSHYPETYTEMYFDRAAALPAEVTAGKQYTYKVHITNHMSRQMSYEVVATEVVNGAVASVQRQHVSLRDGAGIDVAFTFTVPASGDSATVTVALPAQAQYLDFRSHAA